VFTYFFKHSTFIIHHFYKTRAIQSAIQIKVSLCLLVKYKSLSYARVSGEVIHGDNLNFFIGSHENCEKVYNSFTFVTYEKPGDIQQHYNLTPAPFKKIASSSKGHLGLAG